MPNPQAGGAPLVGCPQLLIQYTGCPGSNVAYFGNVFLMLKYANITQKTYVQSWTVTEIMAREQCDLLAGPSTIPVSWQALSECLTLRVESADDSH
jgi:hypothetical protein